MDFENPLALARKVKLGSLGPLADVPFNVRTLAEAGVIRPIRPDKLARVVRELARWGPSPAGGIAGAAVTHGDDEMVIDEAGSVTFGEMHRRSNALARALRDRGVEPGDGIAIMARNHRGFIDATLAVSKLGANGLYMNTAFSGPQLVDVTEREGPAALIYDEEFSELLGEAKEDTRRFISWSTEGSTADPTTEELIESADDADLDPPDESSRFIILTSGTTGTPKGAQRGQPDTLSPLAAMFSRIPLRAGERTVIAAPLFHSWGFAHFMLGLSLNSTYVLQRKFDPEATLKAIAENEATALVVVPVMMQRILQLPEETLAKYDLPSLRVTAASGSALPGPLAEKWMDHFGDNLYNLYGSTEVAWATIATPEDLRAAPGTAGKPPRGTVVKIVDNEGDGEVPRGRDRPRLRRQRHGLRGLHRGRRQGRLRGPALLRRRRSLRRGGPAVHRRPRRRDDRLRGRERVPARGRGPARGPRRGQGGRGDRRRRRRVRPAAEGVRRARRRRARSTRTGSSPT